MSIFDLCCQPKAKKSLDYVLKWIDSASVTLNELSSSVLSLQRWQDAVENNITAKIDEEIEKYDWSDVPQFDTLSRKIDAKANKVANATAGDFAVLDVNGNLVDSGNNYNEITKVSSFRGDVKATKANGSIVSLLDTVESVDATKEKLSITIDRGTSANPTFSVTAGSKNVLKALINKLIQDKAYACIVNMRVGSLGTHRIYSVGGTILWTEKEVDNVVHREITLYVGFTKFVTLCVAGESGWDDPTWSLTWTRSEVDDTPFSNSAVTEGSSGEVDPGTSHTDGPL